MKSFILQLMLSNLRRSNGFTTCAGQIMRKLEVVPPSNSSP